MPPLAPETAARLWARAKPYLPWASLALGVASAALMERRPEKAWMVVAAALGAWTLLAVTAIAGSLDADHLPRLHARAVKLGLASSMIASQSLVQLCLFFALPFYVRAASFTAGHITFFAIAAVVVVLASWDPFFEWVFAHRWASLAVLGFASFTGLACVLPVLGLPNQASLLLAAALTAVGVPVLERLRREKPPGRDYVLWAKEASVVLGFPLFALFGGGALVPPAPLSLTSAAVGTRLEGREVQDPVVRFTGRPPQVVCATAIRAPRGLKDDLHHEWRHDGRVVDRIDLEVRGGREAGFRTWSIKQNLGPDPAGRWTCRVVTDAGQVLGQAHFEIAPPPLESSP